MLSRSTQNEITCSFCFILHRMYAVDLNEELLHFALIVGIHFLFHFASIVLYQVCSKLYADMFINANQSPIGPLYIQQLALQSTDTWQTTQSTKTPQTTQSIEIPKPSSLLNCDPKKWVSMFRKYHNYTLQTNPLPREGEPQNINSNKAAGIQLKQSNQLSLSRQDDCETIRARIIAYQNKNQTQNPHKQWEVHKTINQQQNHRLRTDSSLSHWGGGGGGLHSFYWL